MEQALRRERQDVQRRDCDVGSPEGHVGYDLAKMLSMLRTSEDGLNMSTAPSSHASKMPDWSASLELVRQLAEAMRTSADRLHKVEARAQAVVQRAAKELEHAQARIEALEVRLRASETREKQAEARAKEAEEWLRRMHETIVEALPTSLSLLQSIADPAPGRTYVA